MKNKKTLITYYLITILLALISLYSFNQKGNDFFTALSSLASDFTLIFSVITVIYSLFFCCDYIRHVIEKKDKQFYLKVIIALMILFLSISIVFVSFVTIFSHKSIFDFINNVVNKNENRDIAKLFIESILVYFLIFLFVVNGLIISNKKNDKEQSYIIPFIVITTIIVLTFILTKMGFRLIYSVILIDIILYISMNVLWKKYNKKKK